MPCINVYKQTQDNWYSSYRLENGAACVLVSVMSVRVGRGEPPIWRVCAWGDDDLGMEVDVASESQAMGIFMEVIQLNYVNMDNLATLAFVPA